MSMEEELLADMLAAELLPRTPARCSSGCQDAAAAAAASLMPDGGAAEAAAMGAALQQLFPQASGITLCCPTPGCAGELTLASSNGQTSRQPCACGTLDLMHLASANTCRCILAGTANEQPTAAEQQQLSSFVAELGVQLTQLMKEQNEVSRRHVPPLYCLHCLWARLALCLGGQAAEMCCVFAPTPHLLHAASAPSCHRRCCPP